MSIRRKRRAGLGLATVLAASAAVIGGSSPRGTPEAQAQLAPTTVVCTNGSGARGEAGPTTFDLTTTEGYASMPDGNSVYLWSYGVVGAEFQTPGPVLCVDAGDEVTVNLTVPAGFPNLLPPSSAYDTPTSIVFPGQTGVTASGGTPGLLTNEALGDTVTYTFTASQPGTYLYESGTSPERQVQMGLYGALLVYPIDGSTSAYGAGTSTTYTPGREYLLVLHEIDPHYHHAVETNLAPTPPSYVPRSFLGVPDPPGTLYHYRYWTINGRAMPDTLAPNGSPWLPSQPYGSLVRLEPLETALVRYANAGLENHPFHPHGNHLRIVAQDGRLLANAGVGQSFESFTKTVAAGQTFDLLAQWQSIENYSSGSNPIPVTIPGLQNLVFADDATYFSGSPYLGEKQPLPPGVTDFNECGEYYFPWHTHALFEFQNFDEGFGGMATLWRLDPPGGCP